MSPRPLALVAAVAVSLLSVDAVADTGGVAPSTSEVTGVDLEATPLGDPPVTGYLRLLSSSSVQTDGGSNLRLPPGYYLDEERWKRLDLRVRELQNDSTRLNAENRALRNSVGGWQPGWKTVLIVLGTGLAGGIHLGSKLSN